MQKHEKSALRWAKNLQRYFRAFYAFMESLEQGKPLLYADLQKDSALHRELQALLFTYQRVHLGKPKLYHFDCYRLSKPDELLLHDVHEALGNCDGVVAIEWSEK